MTAPLCFIDTETDGLHPDRKVWEVAMIRRDERGERAAQFFVEVDLSTADPMGLKIGRFYDRHPLGRRIAGHHLEANDAGQYEQDGMPNVYSEIDAALMVAEFTHGAHLVGAVPNFDAEVLANLLRDNRLTPSWHFHLIDVEAMAVGYLEAMRIHGVGENGADAESVTLPYRSDELSLACGVTPPTDDERHTAMGDTVWVQRWYDVMTGGKP